MRTSYEFVLPRGYVDNSGAVHKAGLMRLATARDELEPLRDPTVTGPDDPRLTVLVLARVVERLGTLELVTPTDLFDHSAYALRCLSVRLQVTLGDEHPAGEDLRPGDRPIGWRLPMDPAYGA